MKDIIEIVETNRNAIGESVWIVFLIRASLEDWKTRTLSIKWIIGVTITALLLLLIEQPDMESLVIRMLPGVAFLILSVMTKEQIGYGDGICLLLGGMILSVREMWFGIMLSVLAIAGVSLVLIILKKAKRQMKIPYIPFLLLGTIISMAVF